MGNKVPYKYDETNKFVNTTNDDIQDQISDQAKRKGWSREPAWLMTSMFKEVAEFIQAFEHAGKMQLWVSDKQRILLAQSLDDLLKQTPDQPQYQARRQEIIEMRMMLLGASVKLSHQLAKEYSDLRWFADQAMDVLAPEVSLDAALKCTHDNNEVNAKKTLIDGVIQEK